MDVTLFVYKLVRFADVKLFEYLPSRVSLGKDMTEGVTVSCVCDISRDFDGNWGA